MSTQLKLTLQCNKKVEGYQSSRENEWNRSEFDFDEDADIGDVLWKDEWKRTQGRESEKE